MHSLRTKAAILVMAIAAAVGVSRPGHTDEGMWLFSDLPRRQLEERHGFVPTDAWTDHLRLSSVRFNNGGSASFVSRDGLVLTNHHVGADTIAKLSTADRDLLAEGFLARRPDEELRAPDLELNQLVAIRDVTAEVKAAVSEAMSLDEAMAARRARIARIESREKEASSLRSDVITLFGGNVYHLYQYRRHTDVRLVWAPERAIAFFGGDADNFEFPRFNLDVCLFRVWEDGRPARSEHFLNWSDRGIAADDLVLVSGNPGRTQRLLTVAALEQIRDHHLPFEMDAIRRQEILLQQFSLGGAEAARRAKNRLSGIQNARKARGGALEGLLAPGLLTGKVIEESGLKAAVGRDEALRALLPAWDAAAATARTRTRLLGTGIPGGGQLLRVAQTIVQLVAEDEKPAEERLPEYADAGRESLLLSLYSPAPLYHDLEAELLADALAELCARRGGGDPLCGQLLDGLAPRDRAATAVAATKLFDVAERRRLVEGGVEAVTASRDPLIRIARLVDPEARRHRGLMDDLAEQDRQAYDRIARARFAVRGMSDYPDATFSLRLAFGTVRGYREQGREIPAWTTIGGAFARAAAHAGEADFDLPASWQAKRDALDADMPFNFVCTADIIGGNSGSPVVDREGRLVGIIFDGNIQSLTAGFVYSADQSRAVAVSARAIKHALEVVYGARWLVDEITGR
jgi:hypothetical protein